MRAESLFSRRISEDVAELQDLLTIFGLFLEIGSYGLSACD